MNFETEFVGGAQVPLSESNAWDATNVDRANNVAIGGDPAVASLVPAVALLASPAVTSRNQNVRLVAAALEEQQTVGTIIGVTKGVTTLITLAAAHGRTGWGYVTIAGTSGSSGLNATHLCDYDTSTTSLTLNFDSDSDTPTIPSPSTATATAADGCIDILARIDSAATSASFVPASGYIFRLAYENGDVRKLRFLRYDMGSVGTIVEIAVSADVGLAAVITLTNLNTAGTTDLGMGQDLRFIVEELRGGAVRLRGFINELDDERPTLEFVDQGDDSSSLSVDQLSVSRDDTGQPGFRFWNQKMITRFFAASDYATEELEALEPGGITLNTVRTRVKLRLERSTKGVLTDDFYNQIINEAQYEIIEMLGQMAMFMRIIKEISIESEEDGPAGEIRFTLGEDVKLIQNIRSTTTRRELDWVFHRQTKGGRLMVELSTQDGGSPFEMVYFSRTPELVEDTDVVVIPREFTGCLIQLSIMKGAQYHSDAKLESSSTKEFNRLYSIFANSMSKIVRQSRGTERFQGRTRRQVDRYVPAWQRWGGF